MSQLPPDQQQLLNRLNTRAVIIRNMALAYFACAWADWNDKYGDINLSGKQIMDEMPSEIDPAAMEAAYKLADEMQKANEAALEGLLAAAQEEAEVSHYCQPCDAENFGHYCAMQSLGHGVGLSDMGLDHDWCEVPDIEFHYFDLDPEKYPIPEDEDDAA